MKITSIVKSKQGYVLIDTCRLDNPVGNLIDKIGLGNDDAVAGEYETMVFKCDKEGEVEDLMDLDKSNCSTEKKAEKGHTEMVKKWGEEIKQI